MSAIFLNPSRAPNALMLIRDEHVLEHLLAGECVRCRKPADVREEWHLNRLYRIASCGDCGREESVLVKRI